MLPSIDDWNKTHDHDTLNIWNALLISQCWSSSLETAELFPGLSMGMSFLWESHGKRPMGWDRHKMLWDGNGTAKYVPWTTLVISQSLHIPQVILCKLRLLNLPACRSVNLGVLFITQQALHNRFSEDRKLSGHSRRLPTKNKHVSASKQSLKKLAEMNFHKKEKKSPK